MYEIYKWVGSDCEFMGSTKNLDRAGMSSQAWSLEDGVSEVLIYDEDGVLVEAWVDGNAIDGKEYMEQELEAFFDEHDYEGEWDEMFYDPYEGTYSYDL
jgi:hypothetical protein